MVVAVSLFSNRGRMDATKLTNTITAGFGEWRQMRSDQRRLGVHRR